MAKYAKIVGLSKAGPTYAELKAQEQAELRKKPPVEDMDQDLAVILKSHEYAGCVVLHKHTKAEEDYWGGPILLGPAKGVMRQTPLREGPFTHLRGRRLADNTVYDCIPGQVVKVFGTKEAWDIFWQMVPDKTPILHSWEWGYTFKE